MDRVLGADDAVAFLEHVSPALESVDSSSGAIGTAVNDAIAALVRIIASAPADPRTHDVAAAQHAKADACERLLREPDGVSRWIAEVVGGPVADYARENPRRVEDVRVKMLAAIERARKAPPPRPV